VKESRIRQLSRQSCEKRGSQGVGRWAPGRQEIYQECINRFGKQEVVCRNDADVYNGNRIGATPFFYDLPECEEAFDYRRSE
jgi:hypothetical protein